MQTQGRYSLGSNVYLKLNIPIAKYKTCEDRAFLVAAATLCNCLPFYIRDSQSTDTLNSTLKTFTFSVVFEL